MTAARPAPSGTQGPRSCCCCALKSAASASSLPHIDQLKQEQLTWPAVASAREGMLYKPKQKQRGVESLVEALNLQQKMLERTRSQHQEGCTSELLQRHSTCIMTSGLFRSRPVSMASIGGGSSSTMRFTRSRRLVGGDENSGAASDPCTETARVGLPGIETDADREVPAPSGVCFNACLAWLHLDVSLRFVLDPPFSLTSAIDIRLPFRSGSGPGLPSVDSRRVG
eukprot:3583810-Rhodomonas_salina.1